MNDYRSNRQNDEYGNIQRIDKAYQERPICIELVPPVMQKKRQMIEITPPFFPRPRPAITGDGERTRTLIGATIAQTCLAVAHIIHLNTNLVMDG
jgi:hypothetical protein